MLRRSPWIFKCHITILILIPHARTPFHTDKPSLYNLLECYVSCMWHSLLLLGSIALCKRADLAPAAAGAVAATVAVAVVEEEAELEVEVEVEVSGGGSVRGSASARANIMY